MGSMSDIIGHRGAAGLELENTLPSFMAAVQAGVRRVELDVHQTKDGVFVVCHDASLDRVSGSGSYINELSLAELQDIRLHNGATVPTLQFVLDFARQHKLALIVEYKAGEIKDLCQLLDAYGDLDLTVASFDHGAMAAARELRPGLRIYLAENRHPFDVIHTAHAIGAQGLDLDYRLLNPLTYAMAQRYNLEIMAYTVNWPWAKRLVNWLYPEVAICTDYPDRFLGK